MRWLAAVLALMLGLPLAADPASDAAEAMADLRAAQSALAASESARDRVAALTEIIAAYDAGLAALRSSARAVAEEEAALDADRAAREARVAAALAALERIERAPPPLRLAHPQGVLGAARGALLLDGLTQALATEAAEAAGAAATLTRLRAAREDAVAVWQQGLEGAQSARAAIGTAIAARRDPPRAYDIDPVLTALLLASNESMVDFAAALSRASPPSEGPARAGGDWPLPAQGAFRRETGDVPRLRIDAAPRTLVTAPVTSTVLYAGPFPGAGQIVLLEPAPDIVLVLSGLGETFLGQGEIAAPGMALGLMPGAPAPSDREVTERESLDEAATLLPLYLEVRRGQTPLDPGAWFALDAE